MPAPLPRVPRSPPAVVRIAEEELRLERQSVARTPTGPARKGTDEHQTRLIRFYEDVTNLLVTNIKATHTKPAHAAGGDGEWTYVCMVTPPSGNRACHSAVSPALADAGADLNFQLTIFPSATSPPSDASAQQLIYTPVGMENERPEVRISAARAPASC